MPPIKPYIPNLGFTSANKSVVEPFSSNGSFIGPVRPLQGVQKSEFVTPVASDVLTSPHANIKHGLLTHSPEPFDDDEKYAEQLRLARWGLQSEKAVFNQPSDWFQDPDKDLMLRRVYTGTFFISVPIDSESLGEWKLTVGRSSKSDLKLTCPAISRNHLSIHFLNGEYYITRLSSGKVWVDNKQLTIGLEVLIKPGQAMSVGERDNVMQFDIFDRPKHGPSRVKKPGVLNKSENKVNADAVSTVPKVTREISTSDLQLQLKSMVENWKESISFESMSVTLSRRGNKYILKHFRGSSERGTFIQSSDADCYLNDVGREIALMPGDKVLLPGGTGFTFFPPEFIHERPQAEFKVATSLFESLYLGPNKKFKQTVPSKLHIAEVFIAKEKQKYVGAVEIWTHQTGEKVVKLTDQHTGLVHVFGAHEVLSIRSRNVDGVKSYINVKNPQFSDKYMNQSGVDELGMRVLVDFTDQRLTDFLDTHIRPILKQMHVYDSISKKKAAVLAWNVIKDHVPYDKIRKYENLENRLYSLGEFVSAGVCNERGMLLQVVLQYLGIHSRMEKGHVNGGGRHAWVRVMDVGIHSDMILDPQLSRPYLAGEDHYKLFKDDSTPFAKPKHGSIMYDSETDRPLAHKSWK